MGRQRPYGHFPRAAAAKITSRDENRGAMEPRPVEHERRVGIGAPTGEEPRLIIGLKRAHELHGRDLIGVNVVDQQWGGRAANAGERLHSGQPFASKARGSQICPMTAAAAALAGLARWVRTPGP